MLKRIVTLVFIASLAACAYPPKVGKKIIVDTVPVITSSSSEALKDVAALGAVGMRDITAKEYRSVKADVARMDKLVAARTGGVGAGYHVGTGALAVAGGMSLDSVLGIGLISALFEDKRPDNYMFAKDFHYLPSIYSVSRIDIDVLREAHKQSFDALAPVMIDFFSLDIQPPQAKEGAHTSVYGDYYSYSYFNRTAKGVYTYFGFSDYCKEGDQKCRIGYTSAHSTTLSPTSFETLMALEVASRLPEGYFIYMPPNRSFYRLPMIISGGTAEVRYLVVKDVQ